MILIGAANAFRRSKGLALAALVLTLANRPVLLVLAPDNRSFFAYERPEPTTRFALHNDTLVSAHQAYVLTGQSLHSALDLPRLAAHQEFWHSWRTFHVRTGRY